MTDPEPEERWRAHSAAIAAAEKDPTLSPETGRPVPRAFLARFGAGFIIFGVLWMTGLAIVMSVLLPQHLKSVVPNPDTFNGTMNAFTAVASLVANIVFGNFSDRTRSRFGRRTPWVVGGAILGGVTLFLTGTTTSAPLLITFYCLAMVGLNMMLAPLVALLSDRIPEGNRGAMSAFFGAGQVLGQPIGVIIGSRFVGHLISGFITAGILMAVAGLIALMILPREMSAQHLPKDEGTLGDVVRSFKPPRFLDHRDFYRAFGGRLCMLVSYQMIMVYQFFILQKYIGLGTQATADTLAVLATITMVVSVIGSLISGPLSDKIGRRKVPVVVASVLFALGVAMPLIWPSVTGMYLYAGIAGFGNGVYMSVDQALNVDVIASKEEAGKDLGILNLATTLGQMCGPLVTSQIFRMTGSYTWAFPTSILFALLGCVFILRIKSVK